MKSQVTGVWQLKWRCPHCRSFDVYPVSSMSVCPQCGARDVYCETVVARSVNNVHWFRRPTFSHWEVKEQESEAK